jgi:hydrogenase maturation protease
MARILIIAYGNPLRSDDGLAWHVAERLSHLTLPSEVEIITCHLLTPELAHPVSQVATVLFIDAAREGAPGHVVMSAPLEPEPFSSVFTHEMSAAAVLTVAKELYGGFAQAFAMSVCGECFDHGETVSAKVEQSLPRVVALVREFINQAHHSDLRAT